MATVERISANGTRRQSLPARDEHPRARQRLHRVAAVRQQQGLSLRTASRRLGIGVSKLRHQERETTDVRLSDLYGWQRALDVPIADLLVDPAAPLSRPVMERARLLRLMKTVVAIREQATSTSIQRLAQTMLDQLTEIMPELKDVDPWPSVGRRRGPDEYGMAAERLISDEFFQDVCHFADVGI